MGVRRRRSSPALPPGSVEVAAAEDVPASPPFKAVRVRGHRVLLVRDPAGHVVAFPEACPHLGQPLRKAELIDGEVVCRHHRHRFALDGGRCTWPGGPYDEGLTMLDAGEVDGRVWVRPTEGEA